MPVLRTALQWSLLIYSMLVLLKMDWVILSWLFDLLFAGIALVSVGHIVRNLCSQVLLSG